MSDHFIAYPGVHPSTPIALDAYLAAGLLEARARDNPTIAPAFQVQAQIRRLIAEAALAHIAEPDDG